ncbi:MAG: hypothetical protein WDO70_04620 [Alphaproteobacteria bacterium]
MTQDERSVVAARRLRARNWAVLGILAAFVIAIYAITIIRVHH